MTNVTVTNLHIHRSYITKLYRTHDQIFIVIIKMDILFTVHLFKKNLR